MTRYGFHCSHEQIAPSRLLRDVVHAEQAGFQMAMSSDHFAPWSARQGHSGFTLSWVAAALARTSFRIGSVNAPGQRYHPAIVAQATATLGEMFPGRYWVALASGQHMNEHVTGDPWPSKPVREARLDECVEVIRRLHAGQEVTHDGSVRVDRARLYDLPSEPVPLLATAISAPTAARVARWAEGLVTINQDHETLEQVIGAYRGNGGRGPLALQLHLSWAPTEEQARALAHDQWRSNVFAAPLSLDLPTPEHYDIASAEVSLDTVATAVRISADLGQHAAWLAEYAQLGFDEIYLHHVGQDLAAFIDAFGERVLPQLVES